MSRSQGHLRRYYGIDSTGNTSGKTRDPKKKTLPTKSGTARAGFTLTGTNGTFHGKPPITITRQWVREIVGTGVQTVISGQTGATYVVQAGDVGKVIRFQNTAVNHFGTTVTQSTPTATVIAA